MSPLDDDWREWLAENLIRGISLDALIAPLLARGCSEEAVRAEATAAEAHPYVRAGRQVAGELRRRDWLLSTLGALQRLAHSEVERVALPDRETFLRTYYAPNLPAVFLDAVQGWPALSWTPRDLAERFGEHVVEVQGDREADPLFELRSNHHKQVKTLGEFVSAIEEGRHNDLYMTANNAGANRALLAQLFEEIGGIGELLDTERNNECGFLWLGPAGVVTPLHHDLTNNLLVQLHGRKRVHLIPALQVPWLYNFHHVYSRVNAPEPDLEATPDYALTTPYQVLLSPGEVLFIPAGWWHWVEGLDVTISLSFTNLTLPNSYPRVAETS
jgi:hypothetical protein